MGAALFRGHQFVYVHAARVPLRHLRAQGSGALFAVGQAGGGGEVGGVGAVLQARIGLIALQRGQLHAAEGAALAIAQKHALALGGELEGRVHLARRGVRPAGGIDDAIAVRGNGRSLGENILGKVVGVVGEGIAIEGDRLRGGVVKLYVVVILAIGAAGVGAVLRGGLGDDDGAVGAGHVQREVIFQRVGQAGGVVGADAPRAVLLGAAVDEVALQTRHVHGVHARALGVVQTEGDAGGAQAEGRVQRIAGGVFERAIAINKKVFARGEGDVREGERREGVVGVQKRVALEGDVGDAGVDHFHPVRELAVVGAHGGGVGGHDLAYAHHGGGNALIHSGADRRGEQALQQKTGRQRQYADDGQNGEAPAAARRALRTLFRALRAFGGGLRTGTGLRAPLRTRGGGLLGGSMLALGQVGPPAKLYSAAPRGARRGGKRSFAAMRPPGRAETRPIVIIHERREITRRYGEISRIFPNPERPSSSPSRVNWPTQTRLSSVTPLARAMRRVSSAKTAFLRSPSTMMSL